MASSTMTITLRMRWWLPLYLRSVLLASLLTGRRPNAEKIDWWVRKGIYIVRTPC